MSLIVSLAKRFLPRNNLSQLRQLITNTDGGLDRIMLIESRQKLRLRLWVTFYTFLTAVMVYLCVLSMQTYARYPVTTSIIVRNESFIRLPRIAICNINPFKRRELCSSPYEKLCEPGIDFVTVFGNLTATSIRDDSDTNSSATNSISSNNKNTTNSFVNHLSQAYYNLHDIVLSCNILGEPCAADLKDFFSNMTISIARYGRCFCMFCEKSNIHDTRRIVRIADAPERGLVLLLDARTETYLPHTRASGFSLLFYAGSEGKGMPELNRHSVHAVNGHTNYMSLSAGRQKFLPAPYPAGCGRTWPASYFKQVLNMSSRAYSNLDCMNICINQQVIRKCGCEGSDDYFTLTNIDTICADSTLTVSCRNHRLANPGKLRRNCHCPLECTKSEFEIRISRAAFQAFSRIPTDRHRFGNITKVVVYYSAVEAMESFEAPAFGLTEALAAVGGNMNTFTGLSFLVFFEFADVIAAWFNFIVKRNRNVDPATS
ncbi:hypothetical protein BIW11_05055 [Tropilaelaps mercedesae]|uniref:Uncharacterized protein n=1 Tax=Tropilaelaps mercedesae TaxID=418985 RepID=A0A1V9Y3Y8_9ACAR|nr:hypothetical protein BIW11_05055 [Tropilaelaps mercedesae]